MFTIGEEKTEGGVVVVPLSGWLVAGSEYDVFHKWLDRNIERFKNSTFIFDFLDVSYVDSRGLGLLVATSERAKKLNGVMALAHPSRRFSELLDLTNIVKEKVMIVYLTLDAALADLNGSKTST